MTTDRTRRAVLIAAGLVAAAIASGTRYSIGLSQSGEMSSRVTEAIDLAAPKEIVQIYPDAVGGRGLSMMDVLIYHYDFDKVDRLEKQYQGVSRARFLRGVFMRAIKGHESDSENEKWLAVIDYLGRAIRHPPVEQPINRDGSMVTDPLIVMLLHEGRCGYQARAVVDMAVANHYEARLVLLGAHIVAEVKWGQRWHWIDADAGIPVDLLRSRFAELPSVETLAQTPYVLDSFPARDWEWGDNSRRTIDGLNVNFLGYYAGELLTSSEYFGMQLYSGAFGDRGASKARKDQILWGMFGPSGASKDGITYLYKKGSPAQWEGDRHWGWGDLRTEVRSIPMVPIGYALLRLTITGPKAVSSESGHATVPVRWVAQGRTVCQPDQVRNCKLVYGKLGYEVRVSRRTRGWDYDFRDYDFMPNSGKGDVLVTRDVRKIDGMTFGIDLPLHDAVHDVSELFIEVVPVALDKAYSGEFMWPSNELDVQLTK